MSERKRQGDISEAREWLLASPGRLGRWNHLRERNGATVLFDLEKAAYFLAKLPKEAARKLKDHIA